MIPMEEDRKEAKEIEEEHAEDQAADAAKVADDILKDLPPFLRKILQPAEYNARLQTILCLVAFATVLSGVYLTYVTWKLGLPFLIMSVVFFCAVCYFTVNYNREKRKEDKKID